MRLENGRAMTKRCGLTKGLQMIIIKIILHAKAFMKKILLKLFYGKRIKFGRGFTFRKGFSLLIEKDARVTIGGQVFFNNFCTVSAMKSVSIGAGTIFGENVKIYDNNHVFNSGEKIRDSGSHSKEIVIGENCWIASNVVILRGAQIGNNCVIGAGCVIKGHVPDSTIVTCGQNLHMEPILYSKKDGTAQEERQ